MSYGNYGTPICPPSHRPSLSGGVPYLSRSTLSYGNYGTHIFALLVSPVLPVGVVCLIYPEAPCRTETTVLTSLHALYIQKHPVVWKLWYSHLCPPSCLVGPPCWGGLPYISRSALLYGNYGTHIFACLIYPEVPCRTETTVLTSLPALYIQKCLVVRKLWYSHLCPPSCLAGPPCLSAAGPHQGQHPPGLEQWLDLELAGCAARGWQLPLDDPPPPGVARPARDCSTS